MSYLSRIETERDELRATISQLISGWNRMVDDIAALKKENAVLRQHIQLLEMTLAECAGELQEMKNG